MNFFCSSAEFDQYVTDMELDAASVIKADMDRAVEEAKATFEVTYWNQNMQGKFLRR